MKKLTILLLLLVPVLLAVTYTSPHHGTTQFDDVVTEGPYVDVRAFGAVADSILAASTNDAAFNSAIDTGKPVFFIGNYYVSGTISLPTNGVLSGAGPGRSTITVPNTGMSGQRVITNDNFSSGSNTNIFIGNFSIYVTTPAPVAGSNPGIIRLERVSGLEIRNIATKEGYDCQYVPIDLSGGIRKATISGCNLHNLSDTPTGGALWIRGGASNSTALDSYELSITNNNLQSARDEALAVYGWFNTISEVTISGNNIVNESSTSNLAFGILGYNVGGQDGVVKDITVTGNTISGKTNILTGASRVTFTGNSIVGPANGTNDALFVSAYTGTSLRPTDIAITGNTVRTSARYGIYVLADRANVSGNTVTDTTNIGIYIGSSGEGNTVHNNLVYNTTSHGIQLNGDSSIVTNNVVVRSGAAGITSYGDTDRLFLVGNTVIDPKTVGINVNGNGQSPADLVITNNVVSDAIGSMTRGIYAYAGTYTGHYANNYINGGSTAEYTIPSTLTFATDKLPYGSTTWNPGNILDGDEEAKEITVSGAALGDYADCSFSVDVADLSLECDVTATNTITAVLANSTGDSINLASGTVRARVIGQ